MTAIKRCEKCGVEQRVGARVRRCHQIDPNTRGFERRYYCWGRLTRVAAPAPPREAAPQAELRPQDVAARELERTRRRMDDRLRRIGKLVEVMLEMQRRAGRLARMAAMSDQEVEARREVARSAAAKGRERRRRRPPREVELI